MVIKSKYTKKEIRDELVYISESNQNKVSNQIIEIILYLEALYLNIFMEDIRKRQARLDKLWVDETGFLAIWNGDFSSLSMGCQSCLTDKVDHIRSSTKCDQNCVFCYYYQGARIVRGLTTIHYNLAGGTLTKEEVKLAIKRQTDNIKAIGWLQKEPLNDIQKIPEVMSAVAEQGLHQYLYTNGIHATEENLKILSDSGLNEIRFNLQATDFSERVLRHLEIAREYISKVCIETPMFSNTFENYKKHKNRILDSGVDQINSPELQLNLTNYHFFTQEGMLYRHRKGYASPVSSRHLTYDLMELAEKEGWDLIIHDCSNDTKFYRGTRPSLGFGEVAYQTFGLLPIPSYIYLLDNIFDQDEFEVF